MPHSKISVGNVDIMVLHDAESALPLDQTFPDVPADSWSQYQQRYPEGFNGIDNLRAHFECYLIRSQGQTILVDTGLGSNATNPGTVAAFGGGNDGHLLAELSAAGLKPDDVNTVFLTHLHPDHVGWNTSGGTNTRPAFLEPGTWPTKPMCLPSRHRRMNRFSGSGIGKKPSDHWRKLGCWTF